MNSNLYDALQIRFIKLRITLSFLESSRLPKDKVSAIRGGMGEMLLSMNCVRDRKCEVCDFESECIVQRTFYSKFEKTPEFVTAGGSIGYILECEDYREYFKQGETLDFNLILFGKTIVNFHEFIHAIQTLGEYTGIGAHQARFRITKIRNLEGQPIMKNGVMDMDKFVIHSLYDYIIFRKYELTIRHVENKIVFHTPLTLKRNNEYLQEFQMEAIIKAVRRRIYMLDSYEGIEDSSICVDESDEIPEILYQECHLIGVSRYSARNKQKMILRGIKGYLLLPEISNDLMELLLAGELIHIGKNTSFGFGRYHLW